MLNLYLRFLKIKTTTINLSCFSLSLLILFQMLNIAKCDDYLNSNYSCPKVDIFKDLLKNIPFESTLPISIGGGSFGGKGAIIPENAAKGTTCTCTDNLGVTNMGLVMGMWEIAYLIELTREPNCSMVLGINLPFNTKNLGSKGNGNFDNSDVSFYHAHVYSFPLFTMLNLFTDLNCGQSDYMDLDLLYASELDRAWNEELESIKLTPEIKFLANKEMVLSCSIDAISSFNDGKTQDDLFYCAGSWGFLYPLSGFVSSMGSTSENTSLLATRVLALMHRRGLIKKTFGNENLCQSHQGFEFFKSMYRFSMLYPTPERTSNHALGDPSINWQGDSRVLPYTSNVIYVVWRYRNCCLGAYSK